MSEYKNIKELLGKITDEGLYGISYDDIWTYAKICEIIDREDIDEVGVDAIPNLLGIFELDEE